MNHHINIKYMKNKAQEADPMVTRPISNTELVDEYMNFGSPMNQIVLIEAMGRYAKYVTEHEVDVIRELENTPINGVAWVNAARAWRELCTKNGRMNH